MTVSYISDLATIDRFFFSRLLLRWKGSVWQLVWIELIQFLFLYYILNLTYRFALNEDQRKTFEAVSIFCDTWSKVLPITFILGFYVSFVANRWWEQFQTIPWIDMVATPVALYVNGEDERGRRMRRTIVRYCMLANLLVMRKVSSAVKKRFPTWQHVVHAGLMTPQELEMFEAHVCPFNKVWVPMRWAYNVTHDAHKEGRIESPIIYDQLIQTLMRWRTRTATLVDYDWINVPLVYTQVVNVAVRAYFIACLMGRQILDPSSKLHGNEIDLVFPIFTTLEFIFIMGWLQTAHVLLNPMGEDRDDFEMNYILDRNYKVGYAIVDDRRLEYAPLIRDAHWSTLPQNIDIPYTGASIGLMDNPIVYSTDAVEVSPPEQRTIKREESNLIMTRKASRPRVQSVFSKMQRAFSRSDSSRKSVTSTTNSDIVDHITKESTDLDSKHMDKVKTFFPDQGHRQLSILNEEIELTNSTLENPDGTTNHINGNGNSSLN